MNADGIKEWTWRNREDVTYRAENGTFNDAEADALRYTAEMRRARDGLAKQLAAAIDDAKPLPADIDALDADEAAKGACPICSPSCLLYIFCCAPAAHTRCRSICMRFQSGLPPLQLLRRICSAARHAVRRRRATRWRSQRLSDCGRR